MGRQSNRGRHIYFMYLTRWVRRPVLRNRLSSDSGSRPPDLEDSGNCLVVILRPLASVLIATLFLVEKSEDSKRYNIRWETWRIFKQMKLVRRTERTAAATQWWDTVSNVLNTVYGQFHPTTIFDKGREKICLVKRLLLLLLLLFIIFI